MWIFEEELVKKEYKNLISLYGSLSLILVAVGFLICWFLPPIFQSSLFIRFAILCGPILFYGIWLNKRIPDISGCLFTTPKRTSHLYLVLNVLMSYCLDITISIPFSVVALITCNELYAAVHSHGYCQDQ